MLHFLIKNVLVIAVNNNSMSLNNGLLVLLTLIPKMLQNQ